MKNPNDGYKWRLVGLLWLVCFLNYADRQAITAVFPMLKAQFGFSPVELGLIGSAFAWTYAFGSPIAGFLGDLFSRKKIILGGCLLWSGLTAITGVCGRFWQFILVRALVGTGETVYFPAALSLLSDCHAPATRSRALSLHQSGVYIGTIAGSAIGAWLAVRFGWRAAFLWFGAAGVILVLLLAWAVREPPPRPPEARPKVADVARSLAARPTALLLMLIFVGANFVATIFLVWTPSFLVDKFGFKLVDAGVSSVIYIQLASAVSAPAGGWLADVLARRYPGGRMLVQAIGLLGGAGFIFQVAMTRNVAALPVAMTMFGFCKGLYDSNIWAAMYDFVEPKIRASATGLGNTLGWAGGALGPLFVGLFTEYGHGTAAANMSHAIASGAAIYVVCGAALVALAISTRRLAPVG